jgi:hypothetical protein
MSSVFKGSIKTGTIGAKFSGDASNAGSALVVISYADVGGAGAKVSQAAVAPGGTARVSVMTGANGVLEVWVAAGAAADTGVLEVFRDNGTTVDQANIAGPVRWAYSVQPA